MPTQNPWAWVWTANVGLWCIRKAIVVVVESGQPTTNSSRCLWVNKPSHRTVKTQICQIDESSVPFGWTLVFSCGGGGRGLCPAFIKFKLYFPTNGNRIRGSYMPQWHSASALIRHVVHEYWWDPKGVQRQGKKQTHQHCVAEVDQLP